MIILDLVLQLMETRLSLALTVMTITEFLRAAAPMCLPALEQFGHREKKCLPLKELLMMSLEVVSRSIMETRLLLVLEAMMIMVLKVAAPTYLHAPEQFGHCKQSSLPVTELPINVFDLVLRSAETLLSSALLALLIAPTCLPALEQFGHSKKSSLPVTGFMGIGLVGVLL